MKKFVSCLLAVVLTLTLVCPAFALTKGEKLNLLVLGDSISAGTGLNEGEVPYGKLVADHFNGEFDTVAKNGFECDDVIQSISKNSDKVNNANCYIFSVGSNDYIEYLMKDVVKLVYEGDFGLNAFGYYDVSDFLEDILITHKTDMTDCINSFLNATAAQKQAWKAEFCSGLQSEMSTLVEMLHGKNLTAPVLILNYYDPIEPYKPLISVAADALQVLCAKMETSDAICKAIASKNACSAYWMTQAEKTWKAMEKEFWRLLPALAEMGIDLTDVIPGLDTLDLKSIEKMMQDTGVKNLLMQLKNTLVAVDKLIDFTDDVMAKMNSDLAALAKRDSLVHVVDAAVIDHCFSNISDNDHFHPSQQGHRLIAASAINGVNMAYARATEIPTYSPKTFTGKVIAAVFGAASRLFK